MPRIVTLGAFGVWIWEAMMTAMQRSRGAAILVVLALLLSACTGPGPDQPSSGSGKITVTWLAVAGDSGTTGTTVISRKDPAKKGDFRVEFSENEVGGIGAQSQAGAWNAAITSTLLLGRPLEGEFRFETDGRIDGPSAGALTTAGLIAVARGEKFKKHITMTGTINATGTVGPVGGIPEKVQAAAKAGFTTVLIPLGQRVTTNHAGESVDVVKEGERVGTTVIEVGDIYEAYSALTGKKLEVPGVARDPRLAATSYDKVKPQTDAALARYDAAVAGFQRLPSEVQGIFTGTGLSDFVAAYAAKAKDLQRQGLQAGAYNLASQAAAQAEAITATGELAMPLFTQGLPGLDVLFSQALDTSIPEQEFFAFLDKLSTYSPKSVADVEGLVNAYAGAFDAYSLLTFASSSIQSIRTRYQQNDFASLDDMFSALVMPVLWSRLSRSQLVSADAAFEVGRDNPGAPIAKGMDLAQVGDFFRRGADANLTAFTENVIAPLAESRGLSNDQMMSRLAGVDIAVAAAITQQQVQPAIADYIGKGKPNAAYATLGYGLNNYVRNESLTDKYYNNAILDDNLNITGVQFDAVLGHALDLGKQQLADEIGRLRANRTEPVVSVASYEVAGLLRNSNVMDQFSAISLYNGSFLMTRTLSYLAEPKPKKK
ncbi:MAG: hypothetical protein BGN97_08950 [Microbacterium sp. 69-10]|nr:MAG: hypothetical protein BGN97_08950 [Microbacterium sp. 69-10]